MTITTTQVTNLLQSVLFENPTNAAANAAGFTTPLYASVNGSVSAFANYLATTAEFSIVQQITRYYEGALGRAPSANELSYYVNLVETPLTAGQIAQGASAVSQAVWNSIAAGFSNSGEFATLYSLGSAGAPITTANQGTVINGMYLNILGRSAVASELTYYENQLNNGYAASVIVQEISNSPEFQTRINSNIVTTMSTYGQAVVAGTNSATSALAVTATPVVVASANFTLTTGQDSATATNFYGVINSGSTANTLQGYDVLTGTAGGSSNTLNLTSAGTAAGTGLVTGASDVMPAGLSLTNIQNIVLNTSANAGNSVAFDVSAISGVTSLSVTSAGAFTDNIKASSAQSVVETYNGTGTNGSGINIQVVGGKNVTVTDNSTITSGGATPGTDGVKIGSGTTATDPAGAVVVNENNTTATAVLVDGGTTVTVSSASASGAVTVGATIAASGAVIVNDSGSSAPVIVGAGVAASGPTVPAVSTVNVNATGGGDNITVYGGTTDTIVAGPSSTATVVGGALGTVTVLGSAASAVVITQTGTSVAGTSADTVYEGAAVTITSTGGNISLGNAGGASSTAIVSGAVTITDTNTVAGDTIKLADTSANGGVTGAVTITTTATTGTTAIVVGNTTTVAEDPTGAVSIYDATVVSGGSTYYGNATGVVAVNGAPSVTVTGGGNIAINDMASTQALATISLTGVKGTATIGGSNAASALATLNITNSVIASTSVGGAGLAADLGGAAVGTTATITGTTVPTAGRTLAVNLSGDTSTVTVNDNYATAINVVASGSTANKIAVSDTFSTTATLGQNYSFTNNGTGTLTVTAITDTNAGAGAAGVTISTAGTGAIVLPDIGTLNLGGGSAIAVAPTSFTTTNTGGVTVELNGLTTSFSGGTTGNNVVTVDSNNTTGIKAINGGSGGNNTLVFDAPSANYAPASIFSPISNFQTLSLYTGSYGTYDQTGAGFTTLAVNGGGNTGSGTSAGVSFTNVAAATALQVRSTAGASSTTLTIANAGSTVSDTIAITVNGISTAAIGSAVDNPTETNALYTALGNLKIAGVTFSEVSNSGTITITGAETVSYSVVNSTTNTVTVTPTYGSAAGGSTAATLTASAALTNLVNETLATQSGTGQNLPLTIGTSSTAAGTTANVEIANSSTVTVTSLGTGTSTNTLTLGDNTTSAAGQNNPTTSIVVSGSSAAKLALNYMPISSATDALVTINASAATGAVTTTGVQGATTGLTITGGSGALTAVGSGGYATANSSAAAPTANGIALSSFTTATDSISTGSGGGTITIGYAGSGGTSGTTSINLSSSAAVSDTIIAKATTALGSGSTFTNTGARATITGFTVSGSTTTSDVLSFGDGTESVIKNLAANLNTATPVGADTYSVSNGVITLTGSDSVTQQLIDARAIIENITVGGTKYIGAVQIGSNTVVIASGAANSGTSGANSDDIVLTLSGVTGVTGFGNTTGGSIAGSGAAAGIIEVSSGLTYATSGETTDSGATQTTNSGSLTGYNTQSISGSTLTGTHAFTGLAAASTINDSATSSGFNLSVTQAGTAGSNSLLLNISGAQTITTATILTDNLVVINPIAATTITTLADTSNTLATLNVAANALTGGSNSTLSIGAITDTALSTINITSTGDVTLGASASPLTQNSLHVNLGSSSTADYANHSVYLSGTNAVIAAYDSGMHAYTTMGTGASAATVFTATSLAGVAVGDIVHDGSVSSTVKAIGGAVFTTTTSVTMSTGDNISFSQPVTVTTTENGSGTAATTFTATSAAGIAVGDLVSDTTTTIAATYVTAVNTTTNQFTVNNAVTITNGDSLSFAPTQTVNTTVGTGASAATVFTAAANAGISVGDFVHDNTTPIASGIYVSAVTGTTFTVNSAVTLTTGDSLTFDQSAVTTLSATGTGASITAGSTGDYAITAGASAAITISNAQANLITVGSGSTITLPSSSGVSSDPGNIIVITGDTAGASLTSLTTINGAKDGYTKLVFASSGTQNVTSASTGINVAAATTLAQAEALAVNAHGAGTSGQHYADWFQFQGSTYVVDHVSTGVAATALSSSDIVVKLAGLVQLGTSFAISGHGVLL